MKKKFIYCVLIISCFMFLFFSACTNSGVELGLVGKWDVTTFSDSDIPVKIIDQSGTLVITKSDRYDFDLSLKLATGITYKISDTGILKADWTTKVIQFLTDNPGNTVTNYSYSLKGNIFTFENNTTKCEATRVSY